MSIIVEFPKSRKKDRTKINRICYRAFLLDEDIYDELKCGSVLLNAHHLKDFYSSYKLRKAISYLKSRGAIFKDSETEKEISFSDPHSTIINIENNQLAVSDI